MVRKTDLSAAIEAQLERLACREVMLVDVTGFGEVCFERGLEVIWCNATAALRSLVDLTDLAGDESSWSALQQRGRPASND